MNKYQQVKEIIIRYHQGFFLFILVSIVFIIAHFIKSLIY